MSKVYNLIIIGAGPAGLSVGIEASKAGLDFLILEKGKLVNSIYNFPTNMTFFSTSLNLEIGEIPFISHSDKPTRREALEYYRRIFENYKLNIHFKERVIRSKKDQNIFEVETELNTYHSKNLVVATGFYDMPNLMNVPGEDLNKVKHYYDDAHPYIGMNIVVVGGANSACDVALETWSKGANVTMVVREPQLYQKVKYWILPNIENRIKEGSIKAYFNANISEIKEREVIIDTPDGSHSIPNDYVLAMTGYLPDFELLKNLGISLEGQDLLPAHSEETLETNTNGLYVAGVINAGRNTSKLFIENTRLHGKKNY